MQAFACDLDGTLIGPNGVVGDRTRAAIARAQSAGVPVLIATGRMFRSVKRYLDDVGLPDPVVCYQGAAVVDPPSGVFLLHRPLALDVARDAIAELATLGISPNVYVDDQLYVAEENDYTRRYSVFQRLPVVAVGDLLAWLERPPTKLVAVAEPPVLAEIRPQLERRLDARAFLTTSLPYMLEIGNPEVTKGSGLSFVASGSGSHSTAWSRSATARTTSSCSRRRASASPSRAGTRGCARSPTRPAPAPRTRASRP